MDGSWPEGTSTTTTRKAGTVARSDPPLSPTNRRASPALRFVLSLTSSDVVPGLGRCPLGSDGGAWSANGATGRSMKPCGAAVADAPWVAPAAPSTRAPADTTMRRSSFHTALLEVCGVAATWTRRCGYIALGCLATYRKHSPGEMGRVSPCAGLRRARRERLPLRPTRPLTLCETSD